LIKSAKGKHIDFCDKVIHKLSFETLKAIVSDVLERNTTLSNREDMELDSLFSYMLKGGDLFEKLFFALPTSIHQAKLLIHIVMPMMENKRIYSVIRGKCLLQNILSEEKKEYLQNVLAHITSPEITAYLKSKYSNIFFTSEQPKQIAIEDSLRGNLQNWANRAHTLQRTKLSSDFSVDYCKEMTNSFVKEFKNQLSDAFAGLCASHEDIAQVVILSSKGRHNSLTDLLKKCPPGTAEKFARDELNALGKYSEEALTTNIFSAYFRESGGTGVELLMKDPSVIMRWSDEEKANFLNQVYLLSVYKGSDASSRYIDALRGLSFDLTKVFASTKVFLEENGLFLQFIYNKNTDFLSFGYLSSILRDSSGNNSCNKFIAHIQKFNPVIVRMGFAHYSPLVSKLFYDFFNESERSKALKDIFNANTLLGEIICLSKHHHSRTKELMKDWSTEFLAEVLNSTIFHFHLWENKEAFHVFMTYDACTLVRVLSLITDAQYFSKMIVTLNKETIQSIFEQYFIIATRINAQRVYDISILQKNFGSEYLCPAPTNLIEGVSACSRDVIDWIKDNQLLPSSLFSAVAVNWHEYHQGEGLKWLNEVDCENRVRPSMLFDGLQKTLQLFITELRNSFPENGKDFESQISPLLDSLKNSLCTENMNWFESAKAWHLFWEGVEKYTNRHAYSECGQIFKTSSVLEQLSHVHVRLNRIFLRAVPQELSKHKLLSGEVILYNKSSQPICISGRVRIINDNNPSMRVNLNAVQKTDIVIINEYPSEYSGLPTPKAIVSGQKLAEGSHAYFKAEGDGCPLLHVSAA
ncbi:MAG: hypothetical protein AABZ14_02735, partial [Candidatus Margulisiibacteriota bacterium]